VIRRKIEKKRKEKSLVIEETKSIFERKIFILLF